MALNDVMKHSMCTICFTLGPHHHANTLDVSGVRESGKERKGKLAGRSVTGREGEEGEVVWGELS